MFRALVAAPLIGGLLLVGCGSGDGATSNGPSTATTVASTGTSGTTAGDTTASTATAAPTGGPDEVDIVDFEFIPRTLTIHRGDTVTWVNQDPYDHQIVSTQPDVLDSGDLSQAQTYSKTFTQAGTYTYYCNIHNYMKATIIVQ